MKEALINRSYVKVPCDYCGHEIQFQAAAAGLNAECPHCGRVVRLGTVNLQSALSLHEVTGERIKKSNKTVIRLIALILGWPAFLSGLLTLIGLGLSPADSGQLIPRAFGLVFSLTATIFGLALLIQGRRTENYWVCSACGHRLAARTDLTCGFCQTDLK